MKIVSLSYFDIFDIFGYSNLERNLLRQTNFPSISTIYVLFAIDWHGDTVNQVSLGIS